LHTVGNVTTGRKTDTANWQLKMAPIIQKNYQYSRGGRRSISLRALGKLSS